jgi:hypothetical protein
MRVFAVPRSDKPSSTECLLFAGAGRLTPALAGRAAQPDASPMPDHGLSARCGTARRRVLYAS